MQFMMKKWKFIAVAYLIVSYVFFVFIMDKRTDLLSYYLLIFVALTLLLFIGTFVGSIGLILQVFLKNEKKSAPFFELAVRLGSQNTNILTGYGLILLRRFQPKEALAIFEKAKATTKQFMYLRSIRTNIALCYWKLGQLEEALKIYEDLFYYPDLAPIEDFSLENLDEGIQKNHNFFAQDFVTLGYLYLIHGEHNKALYFTKVGLTKSPNYGPAYDNLGQLDYIEGRLDCAIEHFKKGIENHPGMVDSLYYLTKIYLEENDIHQAKTYFDQIDTKRISGLSTITHDDLSSLSKSFVE